MVFRYPNIIKSSIKCDEIEIGIVAAKGWSICLLNLPVVRPYYLALKLGGVDAYFRKDSLIEANAS